VDSIKKDGARPLIRGRPRFSGLRKVEGGGVAFADPGSTNVHSPYLSALSARGGATSSSTAFNKEDVNYSVR